MIKFVSVLSDKVIHIKYEDGTGINIHKGQEWYGKYTTEGITGAEFHSYEAIDDKDEFYNQVLQDLRRANYFKYLENSKGARAQAVQEAQNSPSKPSYTLNLPNGSRINFNSYVHSLHRST